MGYKFIGTDDDLLALGFEPFFNYEGKLGGYEIHLPHNNENVEIDLYINNKARTLKLYVGTVNCDENFSEYGYKEDYCGEKYCVDCYTEKQYDKYVFEEEIFLDVLCKMCKKGLIKEVFE